MVSISIEIAELKKLLGVKKLGRKKALQGWRYNNRNLSEVEFARNNIVRYFSDNEHIATFQDKCYLDD